MEKYPLLEVKNLVTKFKSNQTFLNAVNDISFTLYKGETIGIVGESGSGKSVTSLSIMQLIPNPPGKITSGEIYYHAKDNKITDLVKINNKSMSNFRGKEIAMIFQEPMTSLNPVVKCGTQIMETLLLHTKISKKEARKKTIDLFNEVQLPDPEIIFSKYPHQLSGGQKQRVMIAMAISCDPKILIADEPTTALDVTVQKTILELLKKLQRQYKMGILFITHDLGLIAELADTVVVMFKGKIVEKGPIMSIFSDPKHPYTKSLLACRPPLNFRVKRLPIVSDFMIFNENGDVIEQKKDINEVLDNTIIPLQERELNLFNLYKRKKVLELKNVRTWFPTKKTFFGKVKNYAKAVDDISFDVYEGETLGLVGESGCGKTTLGRTILKLVNASAGSILYDNVDILKIDDENFRKYRIEMQIIFQDPYSSLNPRITIGNALIEPMRVHGIFNTFNECKKRAIELLKRVGLTELHFDRYPHEFSGGQRQRICIARALVLNPKFIICDESVSALDVSVQAQVLNLLNELKQEFKFTCIFISHDLSVVKFMSDRMVVMQNGKIVEIGDPDQIYANPKSEYTKKLIDSIPKGSIETIKAAKLQKDNFLF